MTVYSALATFVLALHLIFILWVIAGAVLTRNRPLLSVIHGLSLVWAVLVEIFPWTCPLTFAENWLESRAGVAAYHGPFLVHCLDSTVYPNVPPQLLTVLAVAIFLINVVVYSRRALNRR